MDRIKSYVPILLVAAFLLKTTVFAQIQSIGTLSESSGKLYANNKIGPSAELIVTSDYDSKSYWKVNYATENLTHLKTIDDNNWYGSDYRFSPSGVFQLTYTYAPNGIDEQYRIHYIDSSGNSKVTNVIYTTADQSPNAYIPILLQVVDSTLYYVKGNSNGTHQLMRYHKGLSVPQSVCMVLNKPNYSTEYNGNLIIAVKTTNEPDYHFVNCTQPGGPQTLLTIPVANVQNSIVEMCKRGNEIFLAINYTSDHKQIWKTDFTFDGTSVYIDSTSAHTMEFVGDDLYFYYLNFYQPKVLKSTYLQPENSQAITLSKELGPFSDVGRLDGSFFQTYSYTKGIELAHIENDSIRLLRDLFKGTNSGLAGVSENPQVKPSVFYAPSKDTCYLSMTNGVDTLVYLYSVKSGNLQSYFPLNNPTKIVKSSIFGTNFFWYEKTFAGIELKTRSMITDLQPQPEPSVESSSQFWDRTLIYPNGNVSFLNNFNTDYNYIDGCHLLEDGSVIGCFMLRDFYGNVLISSESTINDSLAAATILFRYDAFGKLLWSKSLGGKHTIFVHSPVFDMDSEGNILLAGMFQNKAYFEDDSLQIDWNYANFLVKLDGNTGEILWEKQISEEISPYSIEIQQIVLDEEDNIHLSIMYKHFSCNLDGLTQSSDRSPVNAVAVFNPSGHIRSLENTPTIWTDDYGDTHVFDYDITTHQLFANQSQGYYNWWSSCEYNDWGYAFQISDKEGLRNQSMYLTSSDLGSLTTGFAHNGQLTGYGYFRGTMDADNFQATSPMGSNCHKNAGFQIVYSPLYNHILSMQLSTEPFYPLDSKHFGNYRYVYGTDKNNELVIIKQHTNGDEVGYKRLGQYTDPFNFGDDQFFDVNDTALIFLGDQFRKNAVYGINIDYSYNCYKSILKTPNANWQTDKRWFESVAIEIPENTTSEDLIVFPNPFTDGVEVLFKGSKTDFDTFELIDLNGKVIANGTLNDNIVQKLSFGEIRSGAYFLRFNSPEKAVMVKIVRL